MINKKNKFKELISNFVLTVNKYNLLTGMAMDYGSGIMMYPSEIHMLNAVHKYPGSNITELGKKLAITKSASSQLINKLEKKELIVKYHESENEKNILLRITENGQKAIFGFNNFQNGIFNDLLFEFDKLTVKEIELVERTFYKISAHLDSVIKHKK